MKPITKSQIKYLKQKSAKYIFVYDKQWNAQCTRCDAEFNAGKIKHLSEIKCPKCKATLQVQHTWRMSQRREIIEWLAVPKVIDPHTLVLRFVLAYQLGSNPMKIEECARMVINENNAKARYFTLNTAGEWTEGKGVYFRLPGLSWNKFLCYYADPYMKNFYKEVNKLDCFKYYPVENDYKETHMVTQLHYSIRAARLNEKLRKVGLDNLANEHFSYFQRNGDRCFNYNRRQTSLIKMLRLNSTTYDCLKNSNYQTFSEIIWLQKNRETINADNYKLVGSSYEYVKVRELAERVHATFHKMHNYLTANSINKTEYSVYLDNLDKLKYDITDKYYSMPKNFREADDKCTQEYMEKFEKDKLKKMRKNDKLIKAISDGIRKMDNLQEFLNGSNGLLVYVPESSKDLTNEGKALHNCIGTYVDRIANGKTLVFFVRQLNNPSAPFVAFEYHDGEVVQCRYDHNKSVDDDNILQFVNKFADCLKEAKVC